MGPATARFYQLVIDQELTHNGDSRLAPHVGNAILREDSRGARLAKETKESPRRIDAAVAAVMAVHRAAQLAGAPGWTSTSRSPSRSGGQPRAELLDINDVVWLMEDLTSLGIELQHAGEPKGHLAHDAQDDGAVRCHPGLVGPPFPCPCRVYTLEAHRGQSPTCRNQTAVPAITFQAKPFISSDAKRPCHERAIHSSLDRSPVDNHGQHHNGRDLRRSPFPKVTILPDLALGAGGQPVSAVDLVRSV
jgi:hypothetical protein